MEFQTIPIMRIFDEDKAKEFYLGFLGMELDWEHRFEDGYPIYMQVSLGDFVLHLSEHSGDCTHPWPMSLVAKTRRYRQLHIYDSIYAASDHKVVHLRLYLRPLHTLTYTHLHLFYVVKYTPGNCGLVRCRRCVFLLG